MMADTERMLKEHFDKVVKESKKNGLIINLRRQNVLLLARGKI